MAQPEPHAAAQLQGQLQDLVKAINVDPAMMEFLDTVREPQGAAERELRPRAAGALHARRRTTRRQRELHAGRHRPDRARVHRLALRRQRHAVPRRRPARLRGRTSRRAGRRSSTPATRAGFAPGGGDFARPSGEGEAEIDTVIDIIFAHRDSDGQNTVARRTTRRLLEYFARFADPIAPPTSTDIDEIIATPTSTRTFDIAALLRAIFAHDDFYPTPPPARARRSRSSGRSTTSSARSACSA